jgi:hypothetical protein
VTPHMRNLVDAVWERIRLAAAKSGCERNWLQATELEEAEERGHRRMRSVGHRSNPRNFSIDTAAKVFVVRFFLEGRQAQRASRHPLTVAPQDLVTLRLSAVLAKTLALYLHDPLLVRAQPSVADDEARALLGFDYVAEMGPARVH